MKQSTVGVLTIGQSPRVDVTPSIQHILGDGVTIIEAGGLDHVAIEEMASISPDASDITYISRLRNGSSVKIGKSKLLPLLQKELQELEEKTSAVIMLCTGDFPTIQSRKPIIYPDKVLNSTVGAIMEKGTLGLIIPLEEQRNTLVKKWANDKLDLKVEVASPYEESDVFGAARRLRAQGASLIVMDCMGYNEAHKKDAVEGSGLPVILPRTLTARIVAEYIS
ncbi:AroM family protein [Planomicrobium sp. CPCC 101079]|uniref:AroM family protein n=1 Tax=Planomicrobium sp. CPCC 101079 TaxID=2599618 RepID=UPI0011B72C21|nr:AroM family protein [Planomicrobium sp. CPCC 101079]TWT03642.1 AroM family protein [Planomicrobium sp. CPCC 101079]